MPFIVRWLLIGLVSGSGVAAASNQAITLGYRNRAPFLNVIPVPEMKNITTATLKSISRFVTKQMEKPQHIGKGDAQLILDGLDRLLKRTSKLGTAYVIGSEEQWKKPGTRPKFGRTYEQRNDEDAFLVYLSTDGTVHVSNGPNPGPSRQAKSQKVSLAVFPDQLSFFDDGPITDPRIEGVKRSGSTAVGSALPNELTREWRERTKLGIPVRVDGKVEHWYKETDPRP